MKLKLVERTTGRSDSSMAKISVSPKGTFYVNAKATQKLGVSKEARLKMFQDEDDAQSWYIHICDDGYIKLGIKDAKKDNSAQMNMSDIAKKVIDSFYHTGTTSLKFKLQDPQLLEGKKYYKLELIKESLVMEIPNPNAPLKFK